MGTRRRRLFGVVALLAAMAMAQAAMSEAARAVPAAEHRLNPTNRTITLLVDLKDGDRHLGEVTVSISPDSKISVSKQQFIAAAEPVLRAASAAVLAGLPEHGGYVPLETLRAGGFELQFDSALMELHFIPAIDQRPRGQIRLRPPALSSKDAATAKPAAFSGYVNMRAAADYISAAGKAHTGIGDPRLDLEAAFRWNGIVLEGEATYEAVARSGEANQDFAKTGLRDHRLIRRGTRLVYDMPEDVIRIQAGDVEPLVTGFQRSSDLLGLSLERSYRELRPGANIRPTGRSSFRIERPSTVQVRINGLLVHQVRLRPGEYDLSDLPLRSGANNIQLVISDDLGEQRVLDFNRYFDASLLAEDIAEWGISVGVRSHYEDNRLTYDYADIVATSFYRAGITSELTGELYLQGDSHALMGGASAFWATPFGFFGVRAAASHHASLGMGGALDVDWDVLRGGAFEDGQTLRLSAELRSKNFATAGDPDPYEAYWLALYASYSRKLPFDITGMLSARYAFATDDDLTGHTAHDRYGVEIGLSKSLAPGCGIALSFGYSNERFGVIEDRAGEDGEVRLSVALSWQPDRASRLTAHYDTLDRRASILAARTVGRGVGQWSTSIELAHDERSDAASVSGDVTYYGNRAEVSLEHRSSLDVRAWSRFPDSLKDQRTTLRIGTAIAFADGAFAIGPPMRGTGFAILARHESLQGQDLIVGSEDYIQAKADALGPALVSSVSAYSPASLPYDVPNLPVGYDLGAGTFNLFAPYKAGYKLVVGSSYSVSAYGTLIAADGKPVALLAGTAYPEHDPAHRTTVFTNAAGRFGVQGVAPGRWIIEMATEPPMRFTLDVPEDAVGLFRAGELRPMKGSE